MDAEQLHKRTRKAAHDARTPLTSIAGFAELIAEDASLPEGARENAATILGEAKRLSTLLEDFFDEISAKSDEA